MNECIGGKLRVVSVSITFIFFGLGEIAINLISIVMNYFKYYFILQGITIGFTGILFFYIYESPYYLYKKKTLGDFYTVSKLMILRNFKNLKNRETAILKVQRLLGIEELLANQKGTIFLKNIEENILISENTEKSYLAFSNASIE